METWEGAPTKVIAGRKCLVEGRVGLVRGLLSNDTIFVGSSRCFWVFRLFYSQAAARRDESSFGVAGGTLQVK